MLQKIADKLYINFNEIVFIEPLDDGDMCIIIRSHAKPLFLRPIYVNTFLEKLDEYLKDLRHTLAAKGI